MAEKERPLPETFDTGDADLDAAMARACRWFNGLTAEEQAAHRRAQVESWVRGLMPTGDPEFD